MTDRYTKEVAHAIKRAGQQPAVTYRQGKVVDTDPLTITLGGSDVRIPGVAVIDSYQPEIGHIVHVLRYADTALVLGTSL